MNAETIPPISITAVCQGVVMRERGDCKIVAAQMGRPYKLMLREINPNDHGAKFGVDDLIPLCRAARSVEPVRVIADQLGHDLVPRALPSGEPLPPVDAQTALEHVAEMAQASGGLAGAVLRHVQDGEYSADELAELDALLSATQTMLATQRRAVHLALQAKAVR